MSKQKPKRPTTRQLKNDITVIVKEILSLKKYVNEVSFDEIKKILYQNRDKMGQHTFRALQYLITFYIANVIYIYIILCIDI